MARPDVDDFIAALPSSWQRRNCRAMLADIRNLAQRLDEPQVAQPELRRPLVVKWYCAKGVDQRLLLPRGSA
jgi:hypothetical protein